MILMNEVNRIEIENEFLALLLNKQELFNITQIKSKYLKSDKNKKIFDYSMECFKNYNVINPAKILEIHKDFDIDYFTELFVDTFFYNNAWKDQLKTSEESIIKFYKEDVIKYLNEKIKKEEIKYDEFMVKIKK